MDDKTLDEAGAGERGFAAISRREFGALALGAGLGSALAPLAEAAGIRTAIPAIGPVPRHTESHGHRLIARNLCRDRNQTMPRGGRLTSQRHASKPNSPGTTAQ